jgi:hypothetical protein
MLGNLNNPNSQSAKTLSKFAMTLNPEDFNSWTKKNLYRTSTADMHRPSSQGNKDYVIPGYSGVVPGVKSDNNFGKTFTKISREQFTREKYLPERIHEFFPNRPVKTAMGKTLGKFGGGLEDEYQTISRFHGNPTMSKEHPNYIADPWTTTQKKDFKNPEHQRKHILGTTNLGEWKKTPINKNQNTKSSGFINNWLLCDGKGWAPIPELYGDMTKTEYRKEFNNQVPFHPSPFNSNSRKLKKVKVVY